MCLYLCKFCIRFVAGMFSRCVSPSQSLLRPSPSVVFDHVEVRPCVSCVLGIYRFCGTLSFVCVWRCLNLKSSGKALLHLQTVGQRQRVPVTLARMLTSMPNLRLCVPSFLSYF